MAAAQDVGGCDKIRPLWRHYFQNTQGVACFVDANDRERFPEAMEELKQMCREPELAGVPVLIVRQPQCGLALAHASTWCLAHLHLQAYHDVVTLPAQVANKQDLPHAMSPQEICDQGGLPEVFGSRRWAVISAIATKGQVRACMQHAPLCMGVRTVCETVACCACGPARRAWCKPSTGLERPWSLVMSRAPMP